MFQARTALTELSFFGAPGVRRSRQDDAKVVAMQPRSLHPRLEQQPGQLDCNSEATRLINDEAGIARLREHPIGAGQTRAVRVLPIGVSTDREHGNVVCPRVGAQRRRQSLDAVDARYGNVGEDEIGIHLERLVQRLMAVVGLL